MFWRILLRTSTIMNRANLNRGGFNTNPNNPNPLAFIYGLTVNQTTGVDLFSTETCQQQPSGKSSHQNKQPIESNRFYEKYAEKIKKAQAAKAAENNVPKPEPEKTEPIEERLEAEVETLKEKVKKADTANMRVSKKSLNDVLKVELLQDKSTEEIIQIWNEYHRHRDCLFATLPSSLYETFFENLSRYPSFIFPVPRNKNVPESGDCTASSYEMFFMQSQEHCCYFTPLAAYHLHKEMAPVCLTIYHYPELAPTKSVVLMLGEFDSNILTIVEAQCLANQLQYYYMTGEAGPKLSLHLFNREPEKFDHMRLIRHLEQGLTSNTEINLNQPD